MNTHYIEDAAYRRRRRTKTMMRRMTVWSATLGDLWPETKPRGGGFDNWKTPVRRGLINPPRSSWHTQRRYIDLVLRAAVQMRDSKPEAFQQARVTAIIDYPNLFDSGVHIFFNEDYWAGFAERHEPNDLWTPLPSSRSLLKSFGLRVPEGFREQGYSAYWRDDDFEPPYEKRRDIWIYSEIL